MQNVVKNYEWVCKFSYVIISVSCVTNSPLMSIVIFDLIQVMRDQTDPKVHVSEKSIQNVCILRVLIEI